MKPFSKLLFCAIAFLLCYACGHPSSSESDVNEKELSIKERELALKEKELLKREIQVPEPKVPMVRASNTLPNWNENEEIHGNHPLIGLYVGALGEKPFKFVIETVDTISHFLSGYSSVSGSRVPFEGHYTKKYVAQATNTADNVVAIPSWDYSFILSEPKNDNHNGVFQLLLSVTDAHGSSGSGTWISYDGSLYRGVSLLDVYLAEESR